MSNSAQLDRVFSAPVERVYRAFTTADALVKWMAPHGFTAHVDQFDVPELAGKIEVRVEFKEVSVGTEVHITQSGLPDVIPVDGCYLGWQESLQLLAFLVNPDIPDE